MNAPAKRASRTKARRTNKTTTMKDGERNEAGRLICDHVLSDAEFAAVSDRAFKEEFGENGRKNGSHHRYAFLESYYAGEKRLEMLGKLELFRRTQRLPDYARAEDAIKRGWARFMESEFGISADEAGDKLKMRQNQMLYALRSAATRDARPQILRAFRIVCAESARCADDHFFRKLGHALDDPPRIAKGTYDFPQVLLHHWLTGFWWLMPLKAVADDIARIQGCPNDNKKIKSFKQRLWQFKSRKPVNQARAFFSSGWTGCFYSTNPPLIDRINCDGTLLLNATGRRLLAN